MAKLCAMYGGGDLKKFLSDVKGAVTVFITLLIIPAMLISGTAVDLARIHTAHSTLQNANQLAANTVLTQYNALLYDIYGLMGVAQDDPILWALLDEYIKVTIFGESFQDRSLGTLQVFYGANISMEDPYFPEGKHLRNEEVLRRQIEEYMKFRGPILLVQEFLEKLTENRLAEDGRAIGDKIKIDTAIADIFEKYKELYNAIIVADRCTQAIGGIAGGSFGYMSSVLTYIYDEFFQMAILQQQYMFAETPEMSAFFARMYTDRRGNIRSLVLGGRRIGFSSDGSWGNVRNINVGLIQAIENAKTQADNFKPNFDHVVTIAREIDQMKEALSEKIDDFERRVTSGQISEELAIAFTQPQGSPPKSIIDRYREIIGWEIEVMAMIFRDGGYSYIDDIHKPMLDTVRYRNRLAGNFGGLSRDELANVPFDNRFNIYEANLQRLINFSRDNITYRMEPGFLRFGEHPGDNAEFFAQLSAMMNQPALPPVKLFDGQNDPSGANAEAQQRNLINELLALVNTAYNGLKNEPLGAMYISDNSTPTTKELNLLDILGLIPQAASAPVLNIIQDPLGSAANAGDYILLLSYCIYMFSNYSTSKPESIGDTRADLGGIEFAKTISGVPMSPEVNYFYQSELEYLYNGSESAAVNLSTITRLILLVRLICNYIKVFSVAEVNATIASIKTAFAWAPPLAVILGELTRAAFVAAESVIDVAALRTGHEVPLFKNVAAGQWVATPSGVFRATQRIILSESVDSEDFNRSRGLNYVNYMLFFFITRAVFYTGSETDAATELAKRTGNLIEWNIVNFQSKSNADEALMAQALARHDRFRLEEMKTDFRLTTSADLRMLFLSMAFAQNFSDSRAIGIPRTMPIRATDIRGY